VTTTLEVDWRFFFDVFRRFLALVVSPEAPPPPLPAAPAALRLLLALPEADDSRRAWPGTGQVEPAAPLRVAAAAVFFVFFCFVVLPTSAALPALRSLRSSADFSF